MSTRTFLAILISTLVVTCGLTYYIRQSEPIIEYEREPEFEWSIHHDGTISAHRKISLHDRTSFQVIVDNGNIKVLKASSDIFCTNKELVSVEPFLINGQAVKMMASCDYPYWSYEAETPEGKEYIFNTWLNDYSISYQGVWSAIFYPSGLNSIVEKVKLNRSTAI
ncbi:hypothetical protein [Vibrio splendidus]|uniref:hypothetical protein n=1 Tax=Vibrio splendidus TaxID=29497 RepID=UPI00246933FD|nr:hypothetical protein [Vibrio splendidus]MDH5934463.1 hypothetical protein [Vibrio splendidus]